MRFVHPTSLLPAETPPVAPPHNGHAHLAMEPLPPEGVRRLGGLHSRSRQMELIRKERARADRTGQAFCLVLLRLDDTRPRQRDLLRLGRLMLRRSRITDEIGWFNDHCLAALLPQTPASGAQRFAEDVCQAAASRLPRPHFTLYVYPRDATDDDGGASPADPMALAQARPSAQSPAPQERWHAWGRAAARQPAPLALEPLLTRPLPLWKRALDILGASVGLIATAPPLLAVVAAIKLTSPGPVLFCQRRSGLGGRPFTIYKLRTMVPGAEARQGALRGISEQDGPAFKLRDDPRVTAVGRFLRKTSLDELPQLWNVLKGDMTLVGPRPLPCAEMAQCASWHRQRLEVTPGLTCTWQVRGRSRVTFAQWMRMDLSYVRGLSLWGDVKLLLQTVPAVLLRRGAC